LLGKKLKQPIAPMLPARRPTVFGTDGLRCILDDRNAARNLIYRIHICAAAEQMDGQDCSDIRIPVQGRRYLGRVHIECCRIHVDKHGPGTAKMDRAGGREERIYTRTPASPIGQPKNLTHIQFQAHSGKVPAFQTSLHNLEAFKSIFSFGGSLEALPKEVRGVESAISNAKRFATETVEMLRATLPKKAAVNG
jgi:hypothetical protein